MNITSHHPIALNQGTDALPDPQARAVGSHTRQPHPATRLDRARRQPAQSYPPVDTAPRGRPCPAKLGRFVTDRRTGLRFWSRCNAPRCGSCRPHRSRDYARALAYAGPTHFLTLTQAGADRAAVLANVKSFVRKVRRTNPTFQLAYTLEHNPRGTGIHLHGWVHGNAVDAAVLLECARSARMGLDADVRPWKQPAGGDPQIWYGMKEVLRAALDGLASEEAAQQFLALNGGKVVTTSRRFWRSEETGEHYARAKDAIRAARMARRRRIAASMPPRAPAVSSPGQTPSRSSPSRCSALGARA